MARKGKRKSEDLHDLADADLVKEMDETYRQLFTARLQLATRQLANTSLPRKARRKVARIKTIQRQREIAAAQQAVAEGGA
jgi:large subunit ribosomal protein L29